MTEKEVGELYTRLAFQYESSIDSLLERQIIDTDLATTSREKFYDSLNEEKLRTSKKIRDYRETMRLYMGLMTCKDINTSIITFFFGMSLNFYINRQHFH